MKKEEEGKQPKGGLARYIWAERRRGAEGGRSALVYAGRARQNLKATHWALLGQLVCTLRTISILRSDASVPSPPSF
jgi:hypothetical protein